MDTFSLGHAVEQVMASVVIVSGPVVLAALVVGVLVGIAQAVTQVQDQSIGYGVKIAVVLFILALFGKWMAVEMLAAFERGFEWIPQIGSGSAGT
ncbi:MULTISPECIES: flagellar biosynthetic protein FliQ [Burkholderia]|uniref:Export protein FliQ family 3 n=1 Tax=Burkholderia mayonis TaxID=1385591 RepID=A0A1B4FJF8_9BURK|nr:MULTISPECIES: flagellar biosynthetic protein FliQ [Burkholderia]AGK51019.1 bacterial export s, 3 family protein [Burkholderia thailandensis MSMB121]ATF32282.1 export protein FliQ family 3 [Burkholderia thailandensis]AOJ03742.1 export protein FliQ family 3 [Burkholderia mayonis]KST72348.1 export protein FliQ family 3 [Burkholderia humptydooensis]KVE41581.1 export protein FliQ family 3 [Burkholderia sp. BDU5]